MAGPITGSNGTVTVDAVAVADLTKFSITRTGDHKAYVSSDTNRFTKRKKGNRDWTASIEGYLQDGDVSALPFDEDDDVVLVFKPDGTNALTGSAVVDEISWDTDIETADLIKFTGQVSGNGELAV